MAHPQYNHFTNIIEKSKLNLKSAKSIFSKVICKCSTYKHDLKEILMMNQIIKKIYYVELRK